MTTHNNGTLPGADAAAGITVPAITDNSTERRGVTSRAYRPHLSAHGSGNVRPFALPPDIRVMPDGTRYDLNELVQLPDGSWKRLGEMTADDLEAVADALDRDAQRLRRNADAAAGLASRLEDSDADRVAVVVCPQCEHPHDVENATDLRPMPGGLAWSLTCPCGLRLVGAVNVPDVVHELRDGDRLNLADALVRSMTAQAMDIAERYACPACAALIDAGSLVLDSTAEPTWQLTCSTCGQVASGPADLTSDGGAA